MNKNKNIISIVLFAILTISTFIFAQSSPIVVTQPQPGKYNFSFNYNYSMFLSNTVCSNSVSLGGLNYNLYPTNNQVYNYIDFTNTTPVASTSNGRITINTTYGITSAYFTDSNGFIERINRDGFQTVKNGESTTLNPGELVYFTGITNTVHIVKRACANSAATMPCQGVIADTIASGAFGHMQIAGRTDFAGLDTTLYTTNATVYVSAVTPGGWTSALPSTVAGTNLNQIIGFVNRIGTTNGEFSLRMSPTQSIMRQATGTITAGLIYQTSAGGQPALLPNITLAQMPTVGTTASVYGENVVNGSVTNLTSIFVGGWLASAFEYSPSTTTGNTNIAPSVSLDWEGDPHSAAMLINAKTNHMYITCPSARMATWNGGTLSWSIWVQSAYTNSGNIVWWMRFCTKSNSPPNWTNYYGPYTNSVSSTTSNLTRFSVSLLPTNIVVNYPMGVDVMADMLNSGTTLIGTGFCTEVSVREGLTP